MYCPYNVLLECSTIKKRWHSGEIEWTHMQSLLTQFSTLLQTPDFLHEEAGRDTHHGQDMVHRRILQGCVIAVYVAADNQRLHNEGGCIQAGPSSHLFDVRTHYRRLQGPIPNRHTAATIRSSGHRSDDGLRGCCVVALKEVSSRM